MEGEQGSLNGRREVIRGELRRNVMGQLKDQIYLEDEQLYEQIDTARSGKRGKKLICL